MEHYDTWKLVSLAPYSLPVLGALVLAVGLGVGLACWGVRREPSPRRRFALYALRVMAGLCALFFLLEPALRRMQVARVKSRVAVLVDRSASMAFPVEPGGPSRTDAVAEALETLRPQMDSLAERYGFEIIGFDPELGPTSAEALRTTPPRSSRTDLFAALRAVASGDSNGARKLAGVIVFSDGADNAELASGLVGQVRQTIEKLGVPVSTVAVGQAGLKDLAIEGVKVDDFAFVRNSITAEVEVHARGFSGQAVQVVLRNEGQVVASSVANFSGNDETKTVTFTFTPDQTGRFVYTVSAPVSAGEVVAENNEKSFSLKVIRDRVRVLLVAGRPTWDERFLRGVLRQDANVELISFYILRNGQERSGAVDEARELSLIPFPREEIFRSKIDTFDVIIVLNYGHEDAQISLAPFRTSIESYVKGGGAFAYLGGDRSFGEAHGNQFNPFENVMPVTTAGPASLDPIAATLTPAGIAHPITALGTASMSNQETWASLPKIPGLNLTRAKPGATVLLTANEVAIDGSPAPLLTVAEVGRGRVLTLSSDGSWYWAFPSHAQGAQRRTYERLWSNAIRWLVRDPDLTTLSVSADPPSVEPGRPVGVAVIARKADYLPAPQAKVTVELLDADDGKVVASVEGVADQEGAVRLELPPPAPGAYKVVGHAMLDGVPLGEASDAVAVRSVGTELSDARINSALLEDVAKATGGAFFESPSFSLADVPLEEPPLVEVGRARDESLWDRWTWLLVMTAVIGLEWGVRRRFGYV